MADQLLSAADGSVAQDAVFQALAPLLRELCRDALPDLAPGTIVAEISGIDSLRLLQAIALMEETFDVEIEIGHLDRITTVADILRAIAAPIDARQRRTDR